MSSTTPPERLRDRRRRFVIPALLGFLGLTAVAYGPSLAYPLTDADDLILFSWVARHPMPFGVFLGDWGLDNARYRPLHTVSLWLSYHAAGLHTAVHQAINLSLHLACIWLLYGLICTVLRERLLSWLIAAMALVSPNTASSATWISDRPTLFVAITILIWLRLVVSPAYGATVPRRPVLWLAGLSLVALMSKESGMMLPFLAALWALIGFAPPAPRRRVVIIGATFFAAYVLVRWWMFGSQAAADLEGSYAFGANSFGVWSDLSWSWKVIVAAENSVKNLIAPWLPIFTFDGAWVSWWSVVHGSVLWLPGLVLLVMASKGAWSRLQWAGLALFAVDAVVHCTLFRYRMFYLSQIGLCLFLAGGSWPHFAGTRRRIVLAIAALVVALNTAAVARGSFANLADRRAMFTHEVLDQLVKDWQGRIDPAIVDRALRGGS